MAKIEQFICDACGGEKQDVNHWWEILIQDECLELYPFGVQMLDVIANSTHLHLCGQKCVLTKIDEFMSKLPRN